MADDADSPQIIECEIRLHAARPVVDGADGADGELSASDWEATAVGDPLVFEAVAKPVAGAWNGPLSPGVTVTAPVALADPWWTVRLPASSGPPLLCGQVGVALEIGGAFTLQAGEPGVWTTGVAFEGAIVAD